MTGTKKIEHVSGMFERSMAEPDLFWQGHIPDGPQAGAALIFEGILDAEGQWLPTLQECILDKLLGSAQKEELLTQLAKQLQCLHGLRGRSVSFWMQKLR